MENLGGTEGWESPTDPLQRRDVSSGQGLSHSRGQGGPLTFEGCAHVSRPKRPQLPVKGVWSETQADDEGGSILAAIVAQFLTAIDWAESGSREPCGPDWD